MRVFHDHLRRSLSLMLPVLLTIAGCSESVDAPSAEPAQETARTAQEIHDAALVLDAHADIEFPDKPSRYAGPDGLSRVAPEKMAAGGMDAVVMSVAVGPGPRTEAGYQAAAELAQAKLAAVEALAADPANNTVIARTPAELVAAHEAGQSALILGFQNALILGTEPEAIDRLFDQGVRVFALTHMGHNDFADSSRPLYVAALGEREPAAEHGGLSPLGIAAIERVNALGGIVDISQLSAVAALQTIELSSAPVIASHSNVRSLTDVSRNLSDEEIDRIGETGGVIHVAPFRGYLFNSSDSQLDITLRQIRRDAGIDEDYLYPFELYWEIDDPEVQAEFLGAVSDLLGPASLDDVFDHIDYIVERIGVEHVGIGTDFNHGSGLQGFNDASEALNVTIGLLDRGYSEDDIARIWGGNFLRVWRDAQLNAAPGPV